MASKSEQHYQNHARALPCPILRLRFRCPFILFNFSSHLEAPRRKAFRSFLLSQIVRSVLLLNHSRDADSVFLLTCASLSGIPAAVFNAGVASSDCKLLSGVRETPPVPTNNAARQSKPSALRAQAWRVGDFCTLHGITWLARFSELAIPYTAAM